MKTPANTPDVSLKNGTYCARSRVTAASRRAYRAPSAPGNP